MILNRYTKPLALLVSLALATPGATAPWSFAFGTDEADEEARAVATSPAGTLLAVGSRKLPRQYTDAFAACLDMRGNLLWQMGLGGTLVDAFTSAAAHPEGGWIVAGTRNGTANAKALVLRMAADGTVLWERTWPAFDASVTVRRDGSLVVATSNPGRLVALDARGYVLWRKAWIDTTHVKSVDAAADGSLLITGVQWLNRDSDLPWSQYFVALLAPDGSQRWAKLDGCRGSIGPARLQTDGSAFIVMGGGVATLASDGSLKRFRKFPGPRAAFDGLAPTPSGGMLLAGSDPSWSSDPSLYEAALTRLRADGSVQSSLVTRRAGEDRARAVAVLPDVSTVIVGSTQRGSSGDRDMFITRLEPLIPSGACDLASTTLVAEPPASYPLLPLTLVATTVDGVVQSAHDPILVAYAELRAPCSGSSK